MKIEVRKNLPKYISVVCCIVLYVASLLTYLLGKSIDNGLFRVYAVVSPLFLLSFYVVTCFLSTNNIFCTVFSSYFFIVLCLYAATMLYTGKGQFWLGIISTFVYYSFLVPLLPTFMDIISTINYPPTNEVENVAMRVLIVAVCILFYIVCFTARFIKKRKLNGK